MDEAPKVKLTAISWMVFNCFLAASMAAIMKYASTHYSVSSLMAGYNIIATIITFFLLIKFGEDFSTKLFHLHLLRGVIITISYFLYFYAVQYTKLANVVAIGYKDMVLTCLFCYIFLGEKLTRVNMINLALSFIGAMLIIRPDADVVNKGAILALMFTILWSLGNVIVKMICKHDSVLKQLFYSNLFMSIFSLSVSIYQRNYTEIFDFKILYWILPLAIMLVVQSFGLFKALNTARASIIMPFIVTNVIFGIIFGYVFFGEIQSLISMIGTFLVVAVSIYQIIFIRMGKI